MPKMIPLGLVGKNKNWPGKFCTAAGHEVKGVVFGVNIPSAGDDMISGVIEYEGFEGKTHFPTVWAANGASLDEADDLHIGIPAVQANERFLIVDPQTGKVFGEKSYMPSWVEKDCAVVKINADLSLSWISEDEIAAAYVPKAEEV